MSGGMTALSGLGDAFKSVGSSGASGAAGMAAAIPTLTALAGVAAGASGALALLPAALAGLGSASRPMASFATMQLSAGEHYIQVSKWLGHSSFVLTLTTYADYIREDELAAPKVERGIARHAKTVIALERRAL